MAEERTKITDLDFASSISSPDNSYIWGVIPDSTSNTGKKSVRFAISLLQGANGTNGTNGVGVPSGGTTGQVLAKNSSTDYDTGWITQSGGTPTPVNLSSATSDYSLAVGETAYIDYSSATSVLLHVTTVANGMYQLIINNNKTTATAGNYSYLKPNNTDTGSNAVENLRIYYGSSSGNGIVTHTNFRLGSGITLCSDCIITTRTANKSMHGKSKGYEITNKMLYDDNQFWTDTTTAWTSLGTIAYGEAQTGRIVVYRII